MPVPLATYRVQLHAGFGFDAAAEIADYLYELGVSHLYSSPYLQAGKGSTHGYDVLDHGRVSTDLGGVDAHARMCQALENYHLGQVLDIVPNHMSIASRDNAWWWDVLENGQSSRYAAYFDVDWQAPEAKLQNMVLLPILGDHYGRVVDAGEIQIKRDGDSFTVHYFDHVMPVAPRSLNDLLERAARRADSAELAFIAECFGNLPISTSTDWTSVSRRHRDKEVLRRQLGRLCADQPEIGLAIDQILEEINASSSEVDTLLERQNYRLAFWKTAGQELDYRRFFDINTLVSLRMEEERVFQETHALVLKWVHEGKLDGLRVDHPDGLRDPAQYFQRLRQASTPETWIVAEKILEVGERLPSDWPVAGTTGYDFLNRVGGLFVDPAGEAPISKFYSEFTGVDTDYESMVHDMKYLVIKQLFGSDTSRLASLLVDVCERHKRYRDYTRRDLTAMLREFIAAFPVYRSYVRAEQGSVSDSDGRDVDEAAEAVKAHREDIDGDLIDFFRDLLLLRAPGKSASELVMRFQQSTGPVMAKGVEDTTFYNFNRLAALNEVGGNPSHFGMGIEKFHAECRESFETWPNSMLATTTHDTKRSEDVRARMSLLSEIPEMWQAAVERWSAHNQQHKHDGWPDRNAEYLLYQTLVGAWPIDFERTHAYMLKATRESKAITSWTNPDANYETALETFLHALFDDRTFLDDLAQFVAPLVEPGRVNSLSQVLIKLTAPGVPDIYQGNELWDLSLVDPDNRRPVDYETRRKVLRGLRDSSPENVLAQSDEGTPKLWVIKHALTLRRRQPETFGHQAAYLPLLANGPKSDHVVAYLRGDSCVVVAPRFVLKLNGRWDDTSLDLPPGIWQNVFTGDQYPAGSNTLTALLRRFPVALLVRQEG